MANARRGGGNQPHLPTIRAETVANTLAFHLSSCVLAMCDGRVDGARELQEGRALPVLPQGNVEA
eukprot:2597501-Pyramimonas_sp.AAC.1